MVPPFLLPLLLLLPPCSPRTNLSCSSLRGATREEGLPCILPYTMEGTLRCVSSPTPPPSSGSSAPPPSSPPPPSLSTS